jgi:hypothetical protein
MMAGIYESRSVHLSKIAGKVLGNAKLLSIVRRFERFLDNKAIEVREWYEPIARRWIEAQWKQLGEIRLIVDGTKTGFGHQLLMVSLAYRRRGASRTILSSMPVNPVMKSGMCLSGLMSVVNSFSMRRPLNLTAAISMMASRFSSRPVDSISIETMDVILRSIS